MIAERPPSIRRYSEKIHTVLTNSRRRRENGPCNYSPQLRKVITKCNQRRRHTPATYETYEMYILHMQRAWGDYLRNKRSNDVHETEPSLSHFISMLIEFCEQQQVHSSNLDYHRLMCDQVHYTIANCYRMIELEQTKPSMKFEESLKRIPIHSKPNCIDTTGTCSVCMESLTNQPVDTEGLIQLPCKHTFHASCIKKWLNTNNSCPICRSKELQDSVYII